MDKTEFKNLISKIIDEKLNSMDNLAVPNHVHNSYDSNQLDPSIALLGFPVIQVANATTTPLDIPSQGTFRFYVDNTPRFRLWAYLVYTTSLGVLTGSWRVISLT